MTAGQTTVVIPVWDDYVEGLRSAALPSLRDEVPTKRIVVVDNASSTELSELEGAEIVRAPARISLGAARNLGLEHVKTPYVVFWDADDVMLPGTVQLLEDAMVSDSRLVAFGAGIIDGVSGARHRWPRKWMARVARLPGLFGVVDCLWSLYPSTGATIMKTAAVREAGGYADANSGEDWCLGVSLAFRGRLGWTERPGRVYRIHGSSMWARHMTPRHQLIHARAVRERIRADHAIPGWLRNLLPIVAFGQEAAIGAHALLVAVRRVGSSRARETP